MVAALRSKSKPIASLPPYRAKFFDIEVVKSNCRFKRRPSSQLYLRMNRVNHHAVGMAAHNDEYIHMQNDTLLLISIFQEACPLDKAKVSAEDYLAHCEFEIETLGDLFKYLGLAQAAARSELGWEPKPILMTLIAERVARAPVKSKFNSAVDDGWNFVPALIIRAEGVDAIDFCCSVLRVLGLVCDGDKPTRRLRDLMLQTCLELPIGQLAANGL